MEFFRSHMKTAERRCVNALRSCVSVELRPMCSIGCKRSLSSPYLHRLLSVHYLYMKKAKLIIAGLAAHCLGRVKSVASLLKHMYRLLACDVIPGVFWV